ncbi:UNVERIFIED_CONTAM: Inorganic phosphate transporter 1-4 [Sesamum calycinum]|uniref:Inorganic phosphate transporter 1-4 n=1 Tax=Sesamum calycinum TaxID=2727403 RepID=A0AAW2JM81_9LAMI
MPETRRYTALVAKNAKQAASDMSKVLQVELEAEPEKIESLLRRKAMTSEPFQKDIFSAIGWIPPAKTMNALEEVFRIARAQTLIAFCSTVPGYWFTVLLIDRIGRFTIQLMGFFFMTVFMFALAIPYTHWTHRENRIGFVIMYSLTFFFANFGQTLRRLSSQLRFPSKAKVHVPWYISSCRQSWGNYRGVWIFICSTAEGPEQEGCRLPCRHWHQETLIVLGCINALGMFFTLLVPESKGKSLEELSAENENEDENGTVEMRSRVLMTLGQLQFK